MQNKTYQEDDPAVTYTGTWGHNTSPAFSGGGTSYTNADQASASLSFYGSAVYVMGDKKNDHGIYSIQLDSNSPLFYDGVSGCGGAFAMTCEQQVPTLAFLASNLDSSQHTLKVTNFAGVNQSFFGPSFLRSFWRELTLFGRSRQHRGYDPLRLCTQATVQFVVTVR